MNMVKELLEYTGKAQKELHIAVGVSQPTVSEWVNKKKDPSGERLQKVAEFFGVDWKVVKGLVPMPDAIPGSVTDEDRELWELREAARRDPDRQALLKLAKNGTAKDVKQVMALVDALRATNPDFYDGDDPA